MMFNVPSPLINSERLWASIMAMAEIGPLPGDGSRRLSLSDEDRQARDLFVSWCRDAGCDVAVDCIGNIFATRAGRNAGKATVLFGSHLDTQPDGGRFDGIYGVLGGLEVVRTLNDHGIDTDAPLTIVNWTNEEGARFSPGLTGSSVFAGLVDLEAALNAVCSDGPTVGVELRRIGYAGDLPPLAFPVAAYLEAHIEQGPILERSGQSIGVVEGVQGVRWFQVDIEGEGRHAGTTPMDERRDSFMAAATLSLELRRAALAVSPHTRFTVGRVLVEPGSPNTVPSCTRFSIDLRDPSEQVLETVEASITAAARIVAAAERVEIRVTRTMVVPPVNFDPECIAALDLACTRGGISSKRMFSGAMHDASSLARIAPTAMIFVPCRDGISHNVAEWSEPEHLAAGCQVLADAVLTLARR